MFSNSAAKAQAGQNAVIKLDKIQFRFADDFIVTARFKGTFDAYKLATLLFNRPEEFLNQIYAGIKIVDGSTLKDMDDSTFKALIAYSNTLLSIPKPGRYTS